MKTHKKRFANYLKLGLLLFGISIMLWNCEKDEIINEKVTLSKFKTNRVSIEEIPIIASILNKGGKTSQGRTTELSCGSVDLDNILEIINSEEGKTNYTFSFNHNSTEENVFYNYVIYEKGNGGYGEAIMKYTPDTEFLNNYSIYSAEDLSKFTGKMDVYSYESFCSSSSKKFKNSSVPCPGEVIVVPTGGGLDDPTGDSTGDPTDPGNTGGGSGGGSTCTAQIYTALTCGYAIGYPDHYDWCYTSTVTVECHTYERNSNKSVTCPDLNFAGFTPVSLLRKINGCLDQSLSNDEISWLTDSNHFPATAALANFIEKNNCTQTVKTFTKQALEALMDDSKVDFENGIIIDKTFKDSNTKCIHDKLMDNNSGDNFYKDLASNFDDSNSNILKLLVGNTQNGDWGITKGDIDNTREFSITISNAVESSSNLVKMVTLSHELIHAYMFDTLEDWGYLTYDINNNPILNITCQNGINYNNLNLNSLTEKERFVALICAMNQNGNLTNQWTHDLFNTPTFDVNAYRERLEDLIFNQHNWDLESQSFKNNAQSLFGNNWKREISKAASWMGLESTDGYINYLNGYSNNFQQFLFIQQIRNNVSNLKSDCI